MGVLTSLLDVSSETYATNRAVQLDAIAALADADEIMRQATRAVGEWFGVDRCYFFEAMGDRTRVRVAITLEDEDDRVKCTFTSTTTGTPTPTATTTPAATSTPAPRACTVPLGRLWHSPTTAGTLTRSSTTVPSRMWAANASRVTPGLTPL